MVSFSLAVDSSNDDVEAVVLVEDEADDGGVAATNTTPGSLTLRLDSSVSLSRDLVDSEMGGV